MIVLADNSPRSLLTKPKEGWMELIALAGNPSRRRYHQIETCLSGYAYSRYAKSVSADGAEEIIILFNGPNSDTSTCCGTYGA